MHCHTRARRRQRVMGTGRAQQRGDANRKTKVKREWERHLQMTTARVGTRFGVTLRVRVLSSFDCDDCCEWVRGRRRGDCETILIKPADGSAMPTLAHARPLRRDPARRATVEVRWDHPEGARALATASSAEWPAQLPGRPRTRQGCRCRTNGRTMRHANGQPASGPWPRDARQTGDACYLRVGGQPWRTEQDFGGEAGKDGKLARSMTRAAR